MQRARGRREEREIRDEGVDQRRREGMLGRQTVSYRESRGPCVLGELRYCNAMCTGIHEAAKKVSV